LINNRIKINYNLFSYACGGLNIIFLGEKTSILNILHLLNIYIKRILILSKRADLRADRRVDGPFPQGSALRRVG